MHLANNTNTMIAKIIKKNTLTKFHFGKQREFLPRKRRQRFQLFDSFFITQLDLHAVVGDLIVLEGCFAEMFEGLLLINRPVK